MDILLTESKVNAIFFLGNGGILFFDEFAIFFGIDGFNVMLKVSLFSFKYLRLYVFG